MSDDEKHNAEADGAAVLDPSSDECAEALLDELDFSDLDAPDEETPDENASHENAPDRDAESAKTSEAGPPANPHSGELSLLFSRVNELLDSAEFGTEAFRPLEPETLQQAGLREETIERLALRYLLHRGSAQGREIGAQICLPFQLVDPILRQLKQDQVLAFNGAAEMGDYEFVLTETGRERAHRHVEECAYFGAAPVPLEDYLRAMAAQSIARQYVDEEALKRAFSDLVINQRVFDRLGPAVNSGRGMFIFGKPGNGKTSIAERITKCFGSTIWIPRALGVDGEIIRVFDPGLHETVEEAGERSLFNLTGIDQRWVQIIRPTVVAGGELTMKELEIVQNAQSKICEAPLQLKSNCGTLVIDDFGRQTMPVDTLLNRWTVPLEKRYDFLNLPSGKKVQVPFDQLIIFSTNLEPKDLVDEAFLRRIPYKIEVSDPSEDEFREMFKLSSPLMGFQYDDDVFDEFVKTHYRKGKRPFRACHPRDLLLQVRNYCVYKQLDKELTTEALDFAVESYFSVM
ncbi:MAG: AAA family ATPase [Planctomycetaceae bacterium]